MRYFLILSYLVLHSSLLFVISFSIGRIRSLSGIDRRLSDAVLLSTHADTSTSSIYWWHWLIGKDSFSHSSAFGSSVGYSLVLLPTTDP